MPKQDSGQRIHAPPQPGERAGRLPAPRMRGAVARPWRQRRPGVPVCALILAEAGDGAAEVARRLWDVLVAATRERHRAMRVGRGIAAALATAHRLEYRRTEG